MIALIGGLPIGPAYELLRFPECRLVELNMTACLAMEVA